MKYVFSPVQNILVLVQICFRRTKNNICALIKNFWFSGSFFYVKSQLNLYQNHIHLFNKSNYKKYFDQWHFLIPLIYDALYFPKYAQFLTTPWINLIQDMKKVTFHFWISDQLVWMPDLKFTSWKDSKWHTEKKVTQS